MQVLQELQYLRNKRHLVKEGLRRFQGRKTYFLHANLYLVTLSAICLTGRGPSGQHNAHYSAHLGKESIMATKVIPITDGRKELLRRAKEAKENLDRFVFTRNGKPEAVLLSIEDYEDLMETLKLYKIPGLVETLNRKSEDVRTGRFLPESDVFSHA